MRRVVYILADGTKVYTLKEAQASGQPYKTDVEPVKQGAQKPPNPKAERPGGARDAGFLLYHNRSPFVKRKSRKSCTKIFFPICAF